MFLLERRMHRRDDSDEVVLARYRAELSPVTFTPGFADRVMARVAESPRLSDGLQRAFMRLTPFALAAALVLASMNLFSTRTIDAPMVDRMLGWSSNASTATAVASAETSRAALTATWDDDFSSWGK